MQLLRRLAFLSIGLAGAVTHPARAATLYGIGPWPDGNVYIVDVTTGQATFVGPSFMEIGASGLAFRDDGTLFGYTNETLYTLDVVTGLATEVGPMGVNAPEGALSFQPGTGVLFGISSGNDRLLTIDTITGQATTVGLLGPAGRDTSGLAFRQDGVLFGLAIRDGEPAWRAEEPAHPDVVVIYKTAQIFHRQFWDSEQFMFDALRGEVEFRGTVPAGRIFGDFAAPFTQKYRELTQGDAPFPPPIGNLTGD